jgi:hypothetical protein
MRGCSSHPGLLVSCPCPFYVPSPLLALIPPAYTLHALPTNGNQDLPRDRHGAPRAKAGLRLAAWLQWGALRSYDNGLAEHALQPALRRHWACPGCAAKVIGKLLCGTGVTQLSGVA